jgi:hypothetical protein
LSNFGALYLRHLEVVGSDPIDSIYNYSSFITDLTQ